MAVRSFWSGKAWAVFTRASWDIGIQIKSNASSRWALPSDPCEAQRMCSCRLSRDRSRAGLVITLLSFGFKHGLPVDADLVFDVRCLPNPHFVPALRPRTGRDRAVAVFMEKDASTREFMDRLEDYLRYVIPHYVAEGKSYLTVAIGCTGGRHRSVMIAERLKRALANTPGARVRIRHRDITHV